MSKAWFVYIVECCDDSYYTGVTTNVDRRVKEHNGSSRGAKYTRARRPVSLRYIAEYGSRSEAMKVEASLKKLTRAKKKSLTNSYKFDIITTCDTCGRVT